MRKIFGTFSTILLRTTFLYQVLPRPYFHFQLRGKFFFTNPYLSYDLEDGTHIIQGTLNLQIFTQGFSFIFIFSLLLLRLLLLHRIIKNYTKSLINKRFYNITFLLVHANFVRCIHYYKWACSTKYAGLQKYFFCVM